MEISKADWKVFQEKLPRWQESYMERLANEYIVLLQSDKYASEKFWELEKRIKNDRRNPGVSLRIEKKNVELDLIRLLNYGVITEDDLEGFSKELTDRVKQFCKTGN